MKVVATVGYGGITLYHCPKCKERLLLNSKAQFTQFCVNCGTKLDVKQAQVDRISKRIDQLKEQIKDLQAQVDDLERKRNGTSQEEY